MDPQAAKTCRPCLGPDRPIDAVTVAVVVIAAIVLIYYLTRWLGRGARDRFVSQRAREVYRGTQEIFTRTGGRATFSEYKTALPGADAVMYSDLRSLWMKGALTPEAVQGII